MGQALYRKYRSKNLGEVVGQEHITDTLGQALKSGRIGHAYLFTGPRGTGKTSIARILAHEINNLPYTNDTTHLDIIEIDAASNRRIDEIRELRDKVNIAPTSAKYKVYIIDEVHMLTREAFNALLKTLEEPPQHVVFILATTEVHKLPETIISRTQRFTFKPVEQEKVIAHLRSIADQEKIDVSDDALALIAAHGEGSFRDSISLLDQAGAAGEKVSLAAVQQLLGIPPAEMLQALTANLDAHDAPAVVATLTELRQQGYQPAQIARQLGEARRQQILENGHAGDADFALLEKLLNVPAAHNPERYLEIVLLDFALTHVPAQATTPRPAAPTLPTVAKVIKSKEKVQPSEQTPPKPEPMQSEPAPEPTPAKTAVPTGAAVLDEALWPQVLDALKQKYNTLYGVVRMAQPTFREDGVELGFGFAFHRKRLAEAKNQQILVDIIYKLTGQTVSINCVLIDKKPEPAAAAAELATDAALAPTPAAPQAQPATQPDISSISNIFGGGELLES